MRREITLAKRLTTLRKAINTKPPPKSFLFSSIQNCQEYLDYCKHNSIQLESTNFRGTLYELAAMEILKEQLHCDGLLKVGGANDQGVDIIGKWNLKHFWDQSLLRFPQERSLQDIKNNDSMLKSTIEAGEFLDKNGNRKLISLEKDINILVQCKNHQSKIRVSTIRELTGTYFNHTRSTDVYKNYMFLISPGTLTKQAHSLMDTIDIPMIHCRLSSLQSISSEEDVYKLENWNGPVLKSIYLNRLSRQLLRGLNLELQFELLMAGVE
ncbi:uncharacterized protein PRCAT00001075001 [Priceomyces carsonii]|uniref:uncharacterized protein n=1 Tax=Priceomyces carsonii TaxID=28549 RepID=UPI002ED81915|nr:unnamed protein product [Priceomyces carsonii]